MLTRAPAATTEPRADRAAVKALALDDIRFWTLQLRVGFAAYTCVSLAVATYAAATPDGANRSIGMLDAALRTINKQRADLGAYQNRLEYAVKGLDVGAENLQAAESRIRDADMASEMVDYTKNAILTQSATAMLAQANTKTRTVLQLLQ